MSNLYKGQINQNKDGIYTRVIDYNELLEQKLSAIAFEQETKLRRQRMEELKLRRRQAAAKAKEDPDADPQAEEAQEAEDEGKDEELLFEELEDIPPELGIDYVEQAKERADEIVSKATADAEAILTKAVQEAENLKESARKQAEEQGYAEGMQRVQAQEAQMREELEQLRRMQEQDYADRLEKMEPELMDVVIEVFDQVLQTDFAGRRKILLHLIRRTVQNIQNSREFRIRVSVQDYNTIAAAREEIMQKIGGEAALDIVMDESMQPGRCTIDTDEGIFDCGLDVQLENLTKDLRALSCMD